MRRLHLDGRSTVGCFIYPSATPAIGKLSNSCCRDSERERESKEITGRPSIRVSPVPAQASLMGTAFANSGMYEVRPVDRHESEKHSESVDIGTMNAFDLLVVIAALIHCFGWFFECV